MIAERRPGEALPLLKTTEKTLLPGQKSGLYSYNSQACSGKHGLLLSNNVALPKAVACCEGNLLELCWTEPSCLKGHFDDCRGQCQPSCQTYLLSQFVVVCRHQDRQASPGAGSQEAAIERVHHQPGCRVQNWQQRHADCNSGKSPGKFPGVQPCFLPEPHRFRCPVYSLFVSRILPCSSQCSRTPFSLGV